MPNGQRPQRFGEHRGKLDGDVAAAPMPISGTGCFKTSNANKPATVTIASRMPAGPSS
jgi:hypothetical protein